ncbi:hypothetical protein OC844_004822 [Tilletia horrida]|nr:hypothetical protein OC844_004822 [Tilletia horrida]
MPADAVPAWQQPAATGLPPPLREHMDALQTTFDDCGKMTEMLSRMGDLVEQVQHTVDTSKGDADEAICGLQGDMQSFRNKIQCQVSRVESQLRKELQRSQQDFLDIQARHRKEFDELVARNIGKFEDVHVQAMSTVDEVRSQADDELQHAFERLQLQFKAIGARHDRDLTHAMGQIRQCAGAVSDNVRAAQSSWMRAQAQLVGLNTWAVAW